VTVFKVVRLLDGEPDDLRARWERVLAGTGTTEPGRPERVAWAVPLTGAGFPAPRCTALDVQRFVDLGGALANEAWLAAADPELGTASCRVVAEEVVLRGQDHLDACGHGEGERYKMLSFGRRNPALAPQELSARWRGESGRLGGREIPAAVLGLAYVQNHPVPLDGHEWPYDAVNEVWFDRVDDLRKRVAWFAARSTGGLWSPESWSACVREATLSSRYTR
jgi:hypothetical protein